MRVLVVNAGSSSLKLRLLAADDDLIGSADVAPGDAAELTHALAALPAPDAVGHRIVHGGDRYRRAIEIDPEVEEDLRALTELAPLHQPKAIAALDAVTAALPDVPAVACFDTAFHATLPAEAATYALPAAWRDRWPLRRYGFHGLSHAYAARRAAELLGDQDLRIVSCHLGAGASLAAIAGGRCVDTTMGFTPLEGLVMATRSGSIDPGLVLWLAERLGAEAVAAGLEHESGLAGLAGTADMREVLERGGRGDEDAELALEVYLHRLAAGVAAMATSLGGIDAVVFTGGVGEAAHAVRAGAAKRLAFLGVALDNTASSTASDDGDISAPTATVRTLVIMAREDLQIAREVRALLHRSDT